MKIISHKLQLITTIIEDGKSNNEFTTAIPTQDIVHIIMGSFRMMMLKWKFSKFELDLMHKGTSIMTTAINLIKK